MSWDLVTVDKLDQSLLEALFDNRIGAVRIPEFLDAPTARAAVDGIKRQGLEFYKDVDPPIGRIGITQFEHRRDAASRERYFALATASNDRRRQMFARSGDLVEMVLDAVSAVWPGDAGFAREPDGAMYFAGLVRVIGEGLLHCDWAPHDAPAPAWAIGTVDAQITWNIYCQMPGQGGATVVYNHPWTAATEAFQIPDSYGYQPVAVDGCAQVRIEPAERDLVFFNSRNLHRIERGTGAQRISASSFIGRGTDSRLVFWS